MKHIVYIPGLGYNFNTDLSMEAYAHRMRLALENNNDPKLKYEIKVTKSKYGGNGMYSSDIAVITENDGKASKNLYKIYEFKYGDELIAKYKKNNKFSQLIMIAFVVIGRIFNIVTGKKRVIAMGNKQRAQTIWMVILILSAMLFGVLVLASLLTSLSTALAQVKTGFLKDIDDWMHLHKRLNAIALGITSVTSAMFIFNKSYKDKFYESTTEFLCANNYLKFNECSDVILGKLDELLQLIAENENDTDEIGIHAYSFGSVIALDFLYPYGNAPSNLVRSRIDTLVTIGCPFDFIRTYYPFFYQGRQNNNLHLNKWINVHSSTDILSSNFRNDDRITEPATTPVVKDGLLPENVLYDRINPASLSFPDYVFMIGLKAHTMYWGTTVDAQSFMNNVVQKL